MNLIRLFTVLATAMVVASDSYSQGKQGEVDSLILPIKGSSHYVPEFTLDVPVNPAAWTNEGKGMHVAFGSEEKLYFRTEVPDIKNESGSWEATGWKGERIHTQILVWSPDTLQQVRFAIGNFINEKGRPLNKAAFNLNMVRYVLANYPYGSPEAICGETPYKNGFLMPDRFETFDRFDLPGNTVRPVWLTCDIPADALPGNYRGSIDVYSGKEHTKLNVTIRVQNQLLPKPHEWQYRLDLWQNPWVIADYYHVKPWGEEHKALLKKHLRLYADAGGTYITTYGVHSPWGDNEYAIEGGMIEWIKKKGGGWKFDYHIFDQYVQLAMDLGIDKAITIYTPLPWGERFRYMDESSGNYHYEQWLPSSEQFTQNWNSFLTDLRLHLQKKGWFNKTYLGINENAMEQTLSAIKMVKKHSSEWKITYAGDWHPELDTLLNDYSFLHGKEANANQVKARTSRGQTTTYYVCCNPAKPNNFLFSPPVEGRWISWYAAAHGYNGFLRWAYDSWPADPLRDARYGSWAAGDCFLIYPGGASCIRFEKIRQGIVDYEKIRILRQLAVRSRDNQVKQLVTSLDELLESLNSEKTFKEDKLQSDIDKGKKLLDGLSDKLQVR